MVTGIEIAFPGLVGKEYRVTSPEDEDYNCIAWAVGVADDWWWPDEMGKGHWPVNVPREATVDAFRLTFMTVGFAECADEKVEVGCEKIAFSANAQGVPKHAARQLLTGRWTSKLGKMEDIEHDLRDLEGTVYGTVVLIMKRALPIKE
jgi:hypothetical protein